MENENTIKIRIHEEKNCSWCILPGGQYIYGKNTEEVKSILKTMKELKLNY